MKKTQGTKPLFYKPTDRWQIWVCLVATILLYLAAVALAARTPSPQPVVAGGESVVLVDYPTEPAEPPPPSAEETPQVLPPLDIQSEHAEEHPTPAPPRKRGQLRAFTPGVRPPSFGAAGPASLSSVKVFAVSAPRPEYPYEARRQRLTGSGVALLAVESGSGAVTSVTISRSTGSAILDNAASSGFRRWRFKPGTVSKVQAPITFTLTGAAY